MLPFWFFYISNKKMFIELPLCYILLEIYLIIKALLNSNYTFYETTLYIFLIKSPSFKDKYYIRLHANMQLFSFIFYILFIKFLHFVYIL